MTEPGFVEDDLDLRTPTSGSDDWTNVTSVDYVGAKGDRWTVPAGRRSDGYTVPRALTYLQPRAGVRMGPAFLHDELCREAAGDNAWRDLDGNVVPWERRRGRDELGLELRYFPPTITRRDADGVFRQALKLSGVSPLRAALLWTAVRYGGTLRGPNRPTRREARELALCTLFALPLLLPAPLVWLAQTALAGLERIRR